MGHAPELVTAAGSALGERATPLGIPVHHVERGLLQIPAALAIRRLVTARLFDLVHANEAHAVSAVWLAGAHRRTPFVISRRVGYAIGQSRIARARYNAATAIIANSQWVARQAIASGAPPGKIVVVHEGTEIPEPFTAEERAAARKRWRQPESAPLLGCVGVLLPDKGQEWLIRVLAALLQEFPGIRLLLAGDGPSRENLGRLATELGVSDSVIFAGFVRDVASVYAALDLFLLPSFFEALNNSLLAAMSYGIPAVAFRKGALGEIIQDQVSGILCEAANTAELSTCIRRVLRDKALARLLGENARLRVTESFSADRMVQATIAVYRSARSSS